MWQYLRKLAFEELAYLSVAKNCLTLKIAGLFHKNLYVLSKIYTYELFVRSQGVEIQTNCVTPYPVIREPLAAPREVL